MYRCNIRVFNNTIAMHFDVSIQNNLNFITLLINVGAHNITMGCWELSLILSLPA